MLRGYPPNAPRVISSMDTHSYPGLVYHQHPGSLPPPSSIPAGGHPSGHPYPHNFHQHHHQNNTNNMSWQSSHSPPTSSSSSSSDHTMFSALNRTTDHVDYSSQSYLPRHAHNPNHQHSQQFSTSDSQHDVQFTSSQIESSIGPARALTRRRARGPDEQQGQQSLQEDSFSVRSTSLQPLL